MTIASTGGTVTLGLYDTQSQLKEKASITYVDNKVDPLQAGHKGYATLAQAQAAQSGLAANTVVEVLSDTTEANNGYYLWNGTTLTKSAYDPLTQAKADATTKANAAEANAKAYADTNKLDLSKITYEYVDGNMIGSKTPRYTNLGLNSVFVISPNTYFDSVVIKVKDGDILFLLNNQQQYVPANGGSFAFFAEDPNVNRSQSRITDNRVSVVDTATTLVHQKVTVPTGAKYLMLNTRYTNAAGTVNTSFAWAVHIDAFSSSYTQGTEIISEVLSVPVGETDTYKKSVIYTDEKFANAEKLKISTKNLFNPKTVITGSAYLNTGAITYNSAYRRTIKYAAIAGEWISISGMDGMPGQSLNTIQFWSGDGSTFVSKLDLQTVVTTTSFSFQIPDSVVSFSLNINSVTIPSKLQIEKSLKPTSYDPYFNTTYSAPISQASTLKQSTKNLYDGGVQTKSRLISIGVQGTSSDDDVVSSFIPVEYGKYYTVSGLNLSLINKETYLRLLAYTSNITTMSAAGTLVKSLSPTFGNTFTFYVDDPAIKYVILPLVSSTHGTKADALALALQVEEGISATIYEPYTYIPSSLSLYKAAITEAKKLAKLTQPVILADFTELSSVRWLPAVSAKVVKVASPIGIGYSVESADDCGSSTLFTQAKIIEKGKKSIYANLMKYVGNTPNLGVLKCTPFTVPSGQFDNDGTLSGYADKYSKYIYCHPDIAYDVAGVGGFKYWMISSVLPPNNAGDVTWEDEDLFVSNDAKTWQRVRSLYESDKSYTTATLRLPPHSLATANARKYAFLPCPSAGDTIEISVPADNGGVALDRVNVTLLGLPWKHDPAIIIDGGYVYTYNSYHLSYVDRPGGMSRFIVCVRTNDGINWEVVRTDGSTMLLTEESSRQIFTKDSEGRFNYMYYAYNRGSYQNPKVIKWGDNDYELYYGENFSFRVKGTTPYNFNFNQQYPIGASNSGNHPTVLRNGSTLYLINNEAVFSSSDRGATLTKLPYYPCWLGGVTGKPYKKTACIGDGGKVILVEAQRYNLQSYSQPTVNGFASTNDEDRLFLYEYLSVSDFITKANMGLVDAYIDIQLCKLNYLTQKREYLVFNAISLTATTALVNSPLQRLKICDMSFEEGDTLHVYVTLNSRNGAKIIFGGIDVA